MINQADKVQQFIDAIEEDEAFADEMLENFDEDDLFFALETIFEE